MREQPDDTLCLAAATVLNTADPAAKANAALAVARDWRDGVIAEVGAAVRKSVV